MRTTVLLAGSLTLLPLFRASAQEVRRLTEEEAVRLGLEHSAALRAALAGADEAHAAQAEVRSRMLPSLTGEAAYTRLSGNVPDATFTPPGFNMPITLLPTERDRYQTELRLEQPLFTGLRLRNQERAAGHEATAADLQADQERADVAYHVRTAYRQLQAALAVRNAVEGSVANVERHLEDVRNGAQEGTALRRDLLAAETRHAEVLLARVQADNDMRVAALELDRLAGLPLDTPVEPVDSVRLEAVPDAVAGVALAIVESRPELRALTEQVRSLDRQVSVANGDWLPQLSFVGRYVYSRPNPYYLLDPQVFRSSWEIGLSGRWNLWESGGRPARSRQARARLDAAEARLAAAREEAVVQVTRQLLEVRRSSEAVGVAELNVSSAEESYRVAGEQYAEGAALSSDVLDAEQALLEARSRKARAEADYAIARAALLAAEGRVR